MTAKRKYTKKTGNNNLMIFLAIVIALALISIIAAYFMTDNKTEEPQKPAVTTPQKQAVVVPIEGTWASNYNGTLLTIKGLKITLEQPGVDNSSVIKGTISMEKNIVTFIYGNGPCKGVEGHYQYTLSDKGELFFKLIKDNCASRQEMMSASWFKI